MPRRALRIVGFFLVGAVSLPWALLSRALCRVGLERAGLRLAARVQGLWARALLAIQGIAVERTGAPTSGACLIVANHLSYLDILVLAAMFPGRFVAKREIAGWPVLGQLSRAVGTIFVEQRRGRDVVRVDEAMARTLAAGVPVLLFPEGRSTRGACVERFKSSLLECAVRGGFPCQAVALSYETPRDPWAPASTICWWGGMTLLRHAWGVLGLRGIRARVQLAPTTRRDTDRKRLALLLHADLSAAFEPVRQAPVAPDCPWRGLFEEPLAEIHSTLERNAS